MDRHRPGERTEFFLDSESGRGDYARQAWDWRHEPVAAIPRLMPRAHVPELLAGRLLVARTLRRSSEVHVVGATALPGVLRPPEVPSVAWIATTISDERLALRGAVTRHRWLYYRSTLTLLDSLERRVLQRTGRVLAMSHHTADRLVRAGVSSRNVEVVPVPIDVKQPGRYEQRRRGALFVGRAHDPRKNFPLVLRALSSSSVLRQRGLTVVSAEQPRMPKDFESSVAWHARATDLSTYYGAAELLILPSLQEGLGIVAFEALGNGTPVLARRCGGPDRYLEESGGGVVVDTDDEFISAVGRLLSDPLWLAEAGANGQAYVAQHMSGDAFLDEPTLFRPR